MLCAIIEAKDRLCNMDNLLWAIWLILGVVLIVAEIFTLGFVLLWFGLGAIAAALTAFAGGGLALQFLVFAIVSISLTALSRTIFSKYFSHGDRDQLKTGVDGLPGQIGTVTESSSGTMLGSAVKVYGSIWTAFPADGETQFEKGDKVEVVEVKGSSIYVKKANKELPGWQTPD